MTEPKKTITYADLKAELDKLTPKQLAQPVVWSGDERGGHVHHIWVAEEDWIGDSGDGESWVPRSDAAHFGDDYADADVCIPKGTVHLMVDWP